jgi:hypothetical protein
MMADRAKAGNKKRPAGDAGEALVVRGSSFDRP